MNIEHVGESNNYHKKDSIGKITGFFLFRNLIDNYNRDKVKSDEERRKIKKYGIISVVLGIISLLVSICCIISNIMDYNFLGFSYIVMTIIYIISGIILSLIFGVYGFVFGVMQIRLNRKAIGIFGLIFSILSISSSILLGVFMFI